MPRGSATSIILMIFVTAGMVIYMIVEGLTAERPASVERDITAKQSASISQQTITYLLQQTTAGRNQGHAEQ